MNCLYKFRAMATQSESATPGYQQNKKESIVSSLGVRDFQSVGICVNLCLKFSSEFSVLSSVFRGWYVRSIVVWGM